MNARTNQAAALALIALLADCMARTGDTGPEQKFYDPIIYADRQTGCEYLATGNAHAITPRMETTGHQICISTEVTP